MPDMLQIFLAGVEDIARNMKAHADSHVRTAEQDSRLEEKIDRLSRQVEQLTSLVQANLEGSELRPSGRGRRMMDIKQRIWRVIDEHPEGIRPPEMARIIGTRVQNLYPHLKESVSRGLIHKDESGSYFPLKEK